jgi:hypothetical protein
MFDDIPVNNIKGATPTNLPVGEPEDMFSAVESLENVPQVTEPAVRTPLVAVPSEVSLIEDRSPHANTSAVSAGILKPKMATTMVPQAQSYEEHLDTLVAPEMAKESGPRLSRVIFVVLASICGLAVVSGVIYFVYTTVVLPNTQDALIKTENQATSTVVAPVVEPTSITPEQIIDEEVDREILFGELIDTDGDGIDDSIEQTVGTSVQKTDTDGDGLSDGDEILVWKTDPLRSDTDGDTYLDGMEVQSGYSPLGSGKLFTSSSLSENTTSSPAVVTSTP